MGLHPGWNSRWNEKWWQHVWLVRLLGLVIAFLPSTQGPHLIVPSCLCTCYFCNKLLFQQWNIFLSLKPTSITNNPVVYHVYMQERRRGKYRSAILEHTLSWPAWWRWEAEDFSSRLFENVRYPTPPLAWSD